MMLALGLSFLAIVGSENQLEASKEQLFDAWTMHDAISQVTLGLPTETELTLVIENDCGPQPHAPYSGCCDS